jgi:hypothetical protein
MEGENEGRVRWFIVEIYLVGWNDGGGFGIGDCASGELVSESPLGVCPMLMLFLACG